jgi:hypothetical protein
MTWKNLDTVEFVTMLSGIKRNALKQ